MADGEIMINPSRHIQHHLLLDTNWKQLAFPHTPSRIGRVRRTMIGLDNMLSLAAYAIAAIASLQAGSRAKFLSERHEIGVKRGPLILPPGPNETSPLWDLVQVFQRSVELGLLYDEDGSRYGFTRQAAHEHMDASAVAPHDHQIEPYSLSPYPKPHVETNKRLDGLVDRYIEETLNTPSDNSFLTRILAGPTESVTKVSESAQYWTKRLWHWRKSKEEFEDEFMPESEDGGKLRG